MTEINLLPWRELKREQDKKWFTTLLVVGVVVAVAFVGLLDYYAKSLIENQKTRNTKLQTEITTFNQQIKEIKHLKEVRADLISRMMIVQSLQSRRILTIHLFDELVRVMPKGAFVNRVERSGDNITVIGYTQSNTNISDLMRHIEKNEWIRHPVLTEIKKNEKDKTTQDDEFKLSFVLKSITNMNDGL